MCRSARGAGATWACVRTRMTVLVAHTGGLCVLRGPDSLSDTAGVARSWEAHIRRAHPVHWHTACPLMIDAVAAHATRQPLAWSLIVSGGPISPRCSNARPARLSADYALRSSMSTPPRRRMNSVPFARKMHDGVRSERLWQSDSTCVGVRRVTRSRRIGITSVPRRPARWPPSGRPSGGAMSRLRTSSSSQPCAYADLRVRTETGRRVPRCEGPPRVLSQAARRERGSASAPS